MSGRGAVHTRFCRQTPSAIRAFADDTRHWPAGYVYSSANDLGRFAIALLNDARMRDLLIPRTDVPPNLAPAQYGYGLFIENYRGVPSVWHAGEMPGFSALIRLFPNEKLAVIALANRDGVRMEPILDAVLEGEQITTRPYVNRFPADVFVRDGKLWIRRPDGEREGISAGAGQAVGPAGRRAAR